MIGRTLLHYEILARIGAGGMAEVWRAHDARLNRDVAIKMLTADGPDAAQRRERFVRDARAASSLIHPNIVTIHEINTAGGSDFMVMELVHGETLSSVLARGPLTLNHAIEYAIQIAGALRAAHAAGIVHRDMTPGNIMITAGGAVKVLDFGIAQDVDDSADARSDLFSFGVVLREMVNGVPDVPDSLTSILDRCLVTNPGDRVPSAAALLTELRRLASPPGAAVEVTRRHERTRALPAKSRTRRRSPRWGVAASVVAVLAAGAWAGGPSLVRWIRSNTPAQISDVDASPAELYTRATELLRLHYREGNVERAIAQLEHALDLQSPYPIADARLALAYWRKNAANPEAESLKRALAHAERAVAGDDRTAIAHIALGAAEAAAGDLDKSAAAYEKAEALDPSNWELLWRLGELRLARKDPISAERYFRRSAEAGPLEWEAHSQLGAFLYGQARYTEAIQSFEDVRTLAPDHSRSYANLAAAYHQLDRTDESASVLQRALEIAPDSRTYSNLGTYLYFQGKYPEAVSAFDHALTLNPNSYARWGNLADAVRMTAPGSDRMHAGYRRAIQLARDQLARNSDDVNVRSSVALYLVRDGQQAAALTEIDQVLTDSALPSAVLFKATLVAELAGQRARALKLFKQTIEAGYQLREIRAEPDLASLRADPDYLKIVSQYER